MSHRVSRDDSGIFFKIPSDFQQQLPLYSRDCGYNIRDETLSERVQRALLEDYRSPGLVKPIMCEREKEPRWRGWMQALRRTFSGLLTYLGAFSLGMLAGRC